MSKSFIVIQSAAATSASAIGDWISDFSDGFYLPAEFCMIPGLIGLYNNAIAKRRME